MIQRPMLREETKITPIRYKGGSSMTLDDVKSMVEKACAEYGLNVIVSTDIITSGKIFDRSTTDCVVIKNAEHQTDYFHEVITMKVQGIYAFFEFFYTGTSKNNRRVASGNIEHSTITGSIIGAIKKAMVSDNAMDEESNYYDMLVDAINSIFN